MENLSVAIKTDYITLGELLKLSRIAGSGAEAKVMVQNGVAAVDGIKVTQRGKKLYPGDCVIVKVRGGSYKITVDSEEK